MEIPGWHETATPDQREALVGSQLARVITHSEMHRPEEEGSWELWGVGLYREELGGPHWRVGGPRDHGVRWSSKSPFAADCPQ